jgi:hypothetical protein
MFLTLLCCFTAQGLRQIFDKKDQAKDSKKIAQLLRSGISIIRRA